MNDLMKHSIKKTISTYGTESKDLKDEKVDDSMLLHAAKLYIDKHGELPPSWQEYISKQLNNK